MVKPQGGRGLPIGWLGCVSADFLRGRRPSQFGDGVCRVEDLLLAKWFSSTRLETRTKESNMRASLRVIETRGAQ